MENSTIILLLIATFCATHIIAMPCDKCKDENTQNNSENTSKNTKTKNTNTCNKTNKQNCSKSEGIPIRIGDTWDTVLKRDKNGGIVYKGTSNVVGWGKIELGGKHLVGVHAHLFDYNPPKNYKESDC
ncbi:hypothetical protein O0L34_g11845 [Tuta absoluta]|nr:hypothetical protein O0L34_g11845 [Tuta absoluta]